MIRIYPAFPLNLYYFTKLGFYTETHTFAGDPLKTFKLQNDEELATKLIYKEEEVSTEGNLTDEDKGQLRFKDGVTQSQVIVRATIEHVDENGDVKLEFYLSSKAECEGAEEVIGLKTTNEKEN